jgi:outer membrane receptor for monomeric catechols
MSTKETSQSQQKTAQAPNPTPFDPTAAMTSGLETWAKLTQEGVSRMQALFDELAKLEAKQYEATRTAADEMTKLVGDTFSYANQMTSEWRKLTLEATRRSSEMLARG